MPFKLMTSTGKPADSHTILRCQEVVDCWSSATLQEGCVNMIDFTWHRIVVDWGGYDTIDRCRLRPEMMCDSGLCQQVWACSGAKNQKWRQTSEGHFVSQYSGQSSALRLPCLTYSYCMPLPNHVDPCRQMPSGVGQGTERSERSVDNMRRFGPASGRQTDIFDFPMQRSWME